MDILPLVTEELAAALVQKEGGAVILDILPQVIEGLVLALIKRRVGPQLGTYNRR